MGSSRISIAMCTFNGSRFLSEQLESMLAQTRPPNELVVCDDGSNDTTIDLLDAFAADAPFPVRLFSNAERLGPTKNFERAIGFCEGDIIALSDQDDIWKPSKLEKLAKALEQNPDAAYAFSDAELVDQHGVPTGPSLWDTMKIRDRLEHFSGSRQLKDLLRKNLIVGATLVFRGPLKSTILPIPVQWMHDYWIVCLGSALRSGIPVPETLMMYRRHASQAVGWRKKTFLQVVRDSMKAGEEDWAAKVEQFRRLSDRIHSVSEATQCPPDRLQAIEDKERHLSKRATIRSATGLARISQVLGEAFSGRYQRYSDSWYSVARDLW